MNKEIKEDRIELDISKPAQEFKEHLALPNNKRIVFSGPYGSGKTYFLDKYFSEIEKNPNIIHISPVHYSVASNEDIFELLKHDILFELFNKDIELEKEDYSRLLTYQTFFQENRIKVLLPFIKAIPKLGKSISGIITGLQAFEKNYTNVQIDEEKEIVDFLNQFHEELGSIHEENYYTQLITSLIERLKTKNEGQETILILDDLDRLDPDHIFRILNIFAAHIKFIDDENKFGFDKIILVFDKENIQRIFHNRHGEDVDFDGYLDKFYSQPIFDFNNAKIILDNIQKLLKEVKFYENGTQTIPFNNMKESYCVGPLIELILTDLIKTRHLNLRSLLCFPDLKFKYDYVYLDEDKRNSIRINEHPIISVLEMMKVIVGGLNNLERILYKLSQLTIPNNEKKRPKNLLIGSSVILLQKNFQDNNNDGISIQTYENKNIGVIVEYTAKRNGDKVEYYYGEATKIYEMASQNIKQDIDINPYQILHLLLKKLIKIEAIKY